MNREQKPEWSEKDEERLNRIADFLWKRRKGDTSEIYQQEQDINWLKSLRPQKQWKPNNRQLQSLEVAARYYMSGKISCNYTGKDLTELLE